MGGAGLSWVEIDAAALRRNLTGFREWVGSETKIAAVVKANAYGHGSIPVSKIALECGAEWLAVDSLEEAEELRSAGFEAPVLIMGFVPGSALPRVVEAGYRPVVYDLDTLRELGRQAGEQRKPIRVHLKIETGTHRQGIPQENVSEFLTVIRENRDIVLEGVYTHFANIEDTTDHSFAESQIGVFETALKSIEDAGFGDVLQHAACSAAGILFKRTHLDLIRLGISLYGLWPSKETYVSHLQKQPNGLTLQPVMTWKTRIAQIKNVPAGSYVGYGCSYRTTRPTRLAVLPVGYYEGYDRALSNSAFVLIAGHRAQVRGRICMNMTLVDVTDIPEAFVEDEVVLLGSQGNESISALDLAELIGTIHYEVVTRIHPGLPRVLV